MVEGRRKKEEDLWIAFFFNFFFVLYEKVSIFAGNMKQTIDTYKLTSMEEPSDEILSQIMREAAEDARKSNEEATERYFNQMLIEAQKVAAL